MLQAERTAGAKALWWESLLSSKNRGGSEAGVQQAGGAQHKMTLEVWPRRLGVWG